MSKQWDNDFQGFVNAYYAYASNGVSTEQNNSGGPISERVVLPVDRIQTLLNVPNMKRIVIFTTDDATDRYKPRTSIAVATDGNGNILDQNGNAISSNNTVPLFVSSIYNCPPECDNDNLSLWYKAS